MRTDKLFLPGRRQPNQMGGQCSYEGKCQSQLNPLFHPDTWQHCPALAALHLGLTMNAPKLVALMITAYAD